MVMNTYEAQAIVRQIVNAYPVWTPPERQALLQSRIIKHDYVRCEKGVEMMLDNFNKNPTIADILQFIMAVKGVESDVLQCSKCSNEGWIQENDEGHGTYRKCSCRNQNASKLGGDPELTIEGKPIASFGESCRKLWSGAKSSNPDLSDDDICDLLEPMFPQRAKAIRELIDIF
jgi:hypothetical protein